MLESTLVGGGPSKVRGLKQFLATWGTPQGHWKV